MNGQPRADEALREFEARWKDPTHAHATKLLRARHQQELDALKSRFQLKGAERVPDGSGFSLDPAYDYTKLRNVFAFHRAELSRRVSAEELSAIDRELLQRREGKLLDTLFRLAQRPADAEFVREVQGDLRLASFQHARYDGTLKGTEVGMVLFYTDLIAKLWAMDFERSAPDGTSGPAHVRGFIPLLKLTPSPIYDKESDERSSTRLWFGPRDGAFAKAADKLLFARIATRVYAASSNSLQPGKEAEANAGSASFLGWWNDHYAQIADFEPEYHRLNQIMKWSAALAWLSSAEQLQSLVFLGQDKVQVNRSHWFPRWARANSQLKFRAWESIEFMPAGFGGIDTEAMEILRSRPYLTRGGFYSLSGGVSLASRGKLAARPSLIETAPRIRRANIAEVSWSDQGHTVKSFDKVAYTLRTAAPRQPASVQATSATKLRGLDLEVKQGAFELRFERHSEGLRARVGVNERSIGELTVSRRGADAIEIQFDPLEMEHARAYSKTLDRASTNGDHGASALAARADVKRVIDYDGTYYVEPVSGSQQWLKITPEGRPSVDLAAGADFRFARLSPAFEKGGERWNVRFVDRARVESDLTQVRFVVQEPSPSPTSGVAFSVSSRGPPNRAGQVIDLHLRPAGERRVLTTIDSGSGGTGKGGRTNGGGGLFDDAAGGSRRLAREAARDPEGTIALLAETRAKHLEHAKALLQEGRFQEARLELDRLAAFLPDDLDVAAQRVIAHAASGSRIAAAEAARLPIDAKRLASFLDMADRAGAQLSVHSAEHQQLSTIVRGVVARGHGHEARFISQQGELGIELRLADAKWTSASTATVNGGPRYSLASLDAPPVLDAGPAPHFTPPITAKLRDPLVRAIEPDVLVDAKTGARYQKWTATSTNSAARQSFRTAYGSPGNGCSAGGSDQMQGSDACQDTIYVTEPPSANVSTR